MSVNVNEDLRRTIRMEIQQLDLSIGQSKETLYEEASTKAQFQKDLGHAHSEMRSLSRGASDQLENARVHGSLLMTLERQLQSEIVEPVTGESVAEADDDAVMTSTGSPPGTFGRHDYQTVTPYPDEKSGNRNSAVSRASDAFTYSGLLKTMETRVGDLQETLRKDTKELEDAYEYAASLKEKARQLKQAMIDQGLPDALKRAQEEATRRQAELQKDRDMQAIALVELNKARDSCGAEAKELAHWVRNLRFDYRLTILPYIADETNEKSIHLYC